MSSDEGWGLVRGPHVAHYFRAGRSLCRRWAALGGFTPYEPHFTPPKLPSPSCCATCWRKREKEAAHDRMSESGEVRT